MDPDESVSRDEVQSASDDGWTADEDAPSVSASSGIRSISASDSRPPSLRRDGDGLEEHRNMMLASLLEDYYRTRAAEFLNTANPGKTYTRQSPEAQPLARQLFAQATKTLSSNGLLPSLAISDAARSSRRQYLSGLDNLGVGSQAPAASILNPMHDLVSQASKLTLFPHPTNDLQLTLQSPRVPSHYESSFREIALLGKGGFGKVYQCYSPLDQGTYAVKKIQLSPKLGGRVLDGRFDELQHILREVQALATLDHPNIVRYHATWFEERRQPPTTANTKGADNESPSIQRRQFLLDSHPFSEGSLDVPQPDSSCGIVFAEDTPSLPGSGAGKQLAEGQGWSEQAASDRVAAETLSMSHSSNIFTDGKGSLRNINRIEKTFDASGHVLYIQMSLYPMTLAQYISPSSDGRATRRHCFHLLPTLRLLRAIHSGLRYIHSKGYVHRDIKPGNIFLSSSESESQGGYCDLSCEVCERGSERMVPRWLNPRIGDFGLVTQLAHADISVSPYVSNDSASSAGQLIGTAYYRPPTSNGPNDEKVDIFALGVVFIELSCPCSTAMERVDILKGLQMGNIPPCFEEGLRQESYSAEASRQAVSLARAMVDPDPHTRWSSDQVDDAIEAILHTEGSKHRAVVWPAGPGPGCTSRCQALQSSLGPWGNRVFTRPSGDEKRELLPVLGLSY
ncbi:kinase-like protein [Durotheca rogersii]|uniref:kinase-like protein n=1 Tax=Durotheca rogersii TaxID=419775 RepID=UPI00221F73CB|nr:kinase-like protein [Durotheca rogersii]KAI5860965.1 kinase-like protein [Durotheca rogersii]